MAAVRKFDPLQGLKDQVATVSQTPTPSPAELVVPKAPTADQPMLPVSSTSSERTESSTVATPPTPISQRVTAPPAPARPSKTAVRARKINVYIDPAEQEKLSELDIFLRTQHAIRPSESHIMRAALVLLKSNSDFVDVIKTLREQDPRRNR